MCTVFNCLSSTLTRGINNGKFCEILIATISLNMKFNVSCFISSGGETDETKNTSKTSWQEGKQKIKLFLACLQCRIERFGTTKWVCQSWNGMCWRVNRFRHIFWQYVPPHRIFSLFMISFGFCDMTFAILLHVQCVVQLTKSISLLYFGCGLILFRFAVLFFYFSSFHWVFTAGCHSNTTQLLNDHIFFYQWDILPCMFLSILMRQTLECLWVWLCSVVDHGKL